MRAFNLNVGVVVVSDPNDAEEVGGISGEPCIVAGSRFAGSRCGEPVTADSSGWRSIVDGALKQGLSEVGDTRIEDLLRFGGEVRDDVAVGISDGGEHPRGEVDSVISEDGVCATHVQRSGIVSADGDGRSSAGAGDTSGTGECCHVLEADHLAQLDCGVIERVSQGIGSSYVAAEVPLEVVRSVGLTSVVVCKSRRDVTQVRQSGEDTTFAE